GLEEGRADGDRQHLGDEDAERQCFLAKRLGEAVDGVLGGGIGAHPGEPAPGGGGGNVDDVAAPARRHLTQGVAAEGGEGEEVDLEERSHLGGLRLQYG